MEYYHISHSFWGAFSTYMGKHAKNKTMVNFTRGKNIASNKTLVMIRKVARTSTSTKDIYQIRYCNESYMFSTTFGQAEITQGKIKDVEHQGELINFKILFQRNYCASNNTNFPA